MKMKSILAILIVFAVVFALSCKRKTSATLAEKIAVKAKATNLEKREIKEAEEKEAKEEGEEGKEQAKKEKVELPPEVAKVVRDNVPDAEIDIMDVEKEAGITLYDIEFKTGKGEIEVAEDGTVMDIAIIIQMKDVPTPAADAIQKAVDTAKAKIKQLEKSEIRAEIQKEGEKGKIVKLATPKVVYEAELMKGDQTGEIQVDPDGKVVEKLKWGAEGKEKAEKPEPIKK